MEKTTPHSIEIPSALPGVEDDQLREKLLLETTGEDPDDNADKDDMDLGLEVPKPRRGRLARTLAAFAVFVCILGVTISWFFGMGWFAVQKAQPISRNTSKDGQTTPVTEDEKLKMALAMVAAPPINAKVADPKGLAVPDENSTGKGDVDLRANETITLPAAGAQQDQNAPVNTNESVSLPAPRENLPDNTSSNASKAVGVPKARVSDDAPARSLFFGLPKKLVKEDEPQKSEAAKATDAGISASVPPAQIPFGTLLPVRLVGSVYTLRNSAGVVRMELTRPVEGKGYSYPAGTMVVGNVRGGESVRAFVSVVGLIDPVSGELVRFGGELLGRDGGSGIEGKRRNLTSQWSRFFRGMKETAASVLGSVGGNRSGSTVVLSEPLRRGSESMTGELSASILDNEREDTFLEVVAGSSGYVLVTGLPENSAAATNKPAREAAKE